MIEEAGIESAKDANEDDLLEKIRSNVEKLQQIMEPSEDIADDSITHMQPKKVLH